MKANELMIGDWVRIVDDDTDQSFETRITGVSGLGNIYAPLPEGEHAYPFSVDCIEPIPITPEILEKNGFKQDPKSRSRKSHQIITNDVYISWWKGRLNIMYKPFVGHSTNHINCDGKYVHELQHALRLAGIEKEIVL